MKGLTAVELFSSAVNPMCYIGVVGVFDISGLRLKEVRRVPPEPFPIRDTFSRA